ncbi:MAG: hypothetical protein FD165_1691 [Gammaproteobacteria bacterium]|nr:MAG: hypothetical protein FD165_1691 [Gammaproteobacteria bacterium]TND02661.1 MAG: hypothetical protein FD120_2122 [Gammaproteobacteria bacterium]
MVDYVDSGKLIGSIAVSPESPRAGESFLVQVLAPNGEQYGNSETPFVRINGVTGSEQYLQYDRPGTKQILVSVLAEDKAERQTLAIQIKPAAGSEHEAADTPVAPDRPRYARSRKAVLPMLTITRAPDTQYLLGFSVGIAPPDNGLSKRKTPPLTHRLGATYNYSSYLDETSNRDRASVAAFGRNATMEAGHDRGIEVRRSSPCLPTSGGKRFVQLPTGRQIAVPVNAVQLASRPGKPAVFVGIDRVGEIGELVHRLPGDNADPGGRVFKWDFGDGKKLTTSEPSVEYDYEASLGIEREHEQFHVTVRIERPGADPVEIKRTVSIFNAYVMAKRRGYLLPRVTGDVFATKNLLSFEGTVVIHNREAYPIQLTERRVQPMYVDHNRMTVPGPGLRLNPPVTVAANATVSLAVSVPIADVPPDQTTGFVVYYGGTSKDNRYCVRVEAFLELRARDRRSAAITLGPIIAASKLPGVKDLLKDYYTRTSPAPDVTGARSTVRYQRLGNLGYVDLVKYPHIKAPGDAALPAGSDMVPLSTTWPDPAVEGGECDPDNLPEMVPEGFVCQATSETREVRVPARFMNARKGDIILSPGGNGLIGGLLRQVLPPQRYSHSGMMTRNYDQVTHSTASQDRLLNYPVGSILGETAPSEGHRPDVLKYMWPGVVTQTTEEAVYGEPYLDPETAALPPDQQDWYSISSFAPRRTGMDVNGVWEIVPPLVVKPDPFLETAEIRQRLHNVANDALAQTGNSHYRFYCYTDPSIGQTTFAPAEAGWASGTYPSVCSSFIWMALKRQAVVLESPAATVPEADLEPLDRAAGAQVSVSTRDGVYLYTAAERRAAGAWLHSALEELVEGQLESKLGPLAGAADFFSDITDDVANQVVNTFASDWSDTAAKDSDAWKTTGEANAVSPDNILFWDSPLLQGLYGYAAPLVYRDPRRETVTIWRWRRELLTGALTGRVFYRGTPVQGAYVQLYDGKTAITPPGGIYNLTEIPHGDYEVKAWKDNSDGSFQSATVPVTINSPSRVLDINLLGPSQDYRRVIIQGTMHTVDDETFGSNEVGDHSYYREVDVGPWHTHDETTIVHKVGGEVRIELRFVVDLNMDRSVRIIVDGKLYEGTSEDTGDLDGDYSFNFVVPMNMWQGGWINLVNEDEGGDWSRSDFTVTNTVQP